MRKTILLAFAMSAAAILAACSSSGASGLTGVAWQLTAITEKVPAFQGVVPAADQAKYAITFNTDGTFTGTADCNQIAGTYKTVGSNAITITPGISTMAMCGEGSLDLLFVHSLGKAKTYAVANQQLTLTLTDDGTMTFGVGTPAASAAASAGTSAAPAASVAASTAPTAKPTPKPTAKPTTKPTAAPTAKPGASATPAPATGLTGKAWQLTSITEKTPAFQGNVPDAQQANYTIQFQADGTFSAKADCNTVSGTYVTADPSAASGDLAITVGPTTTAACPDGSLADLFVIGLGNAASYAVASNQLTITLQDQGTLAFK
jgi:heat shock protein HslJ